MSVFITNSKTQKVSVSFVGKTNYFNPAERLVSVSGWDGAAVSIGACGASDTGANPVLDLFIKGVDF